MLLAGKHVLVEKPAVTRVADWDRLVRLAAEQGLLLMEAMKVMCFPAMRELLGRLAALPAPDRLRAAFGSVQARDSKLFDPALAGGAAWDVGVYPLWLYAALCHQLGLAAGEPEVTLSRQAGEVDEAARFDFAGPLKAELAASIVADLDKSAWLSGPGWALELVGRGGIPADGVAGRRPLPAWPDDIVQPVGGGGMQHRRIFATCVRQGLSDSPWVPQALSRQVLGWVERGLQPAKR